MYRTILGLVVAGVCVLADPPTYSKEISRIFRVRCEPCHRDGDIAPFALKDYDTASAWSLDIQRVVTDRIMPPWKPVAGHGDFANSRALTDDERQAILDWIDAGAPQGDPADLPEPLPERGDWALGYPDIELAPDNDFTPPANGDTYRCFVLPDVISDRQMISAVDILPGDRRMVHHVILFLDTSGAAAQMDGVDGQPGYDCFGGPKFTLSLNFSLGGWAPGQQPDFLPDGLAMDLPKGARVVMQVHYHPAGRTSSDRTRVGLYTAKSEVKQRLFIVPVMNTNFTIPPGADAYQVKASFPIFPLLDGQAIWIFPHMHLVGKVIEANLVKKGGKETVPLILEDDWDFNWQGSYTYASPIKFSAGDTIRVTCTYNNTDSNPRNPNNPIAAVRFGEATTDEMCIAFLGVTLDYEKYLPLP